MASLRPLRGGCQCGRNSYIVNLPENAADVAQVLFDADPRHRIFQASPLAAFLRVPLSWYHSRTLPFFPDEHSAAIRRTYTHPSQSQSKRGFCGFCGTPLSYWSEDPPSEADFIRLTLGSLCSDDLGDLEDLGLVPDSDEDERATKTDTATQAGAAPRLGTEEPTHSRQLAGRETFGIPWFDSMMAGSRLGRSQTSSVRTTSRVSGQTGSGVRFEWEVVEWTSSDGDGSDGVLGSSPSGHPSPSKRPRHDGDDEEGGGGGPAVTTLMTGTY